MSGQVRVVEELTGFRIWRIKIFPDKEPVLQSLTYQNSLWTEPVFEADRLPTLRNQHGVYAYSSIEKLLERVVLLDDRIAGSVEACGQVVLHEDGFRAERVQIKELALPLCGYCCKEAKWLVVHDSFLDYKCVCEEHVRRGYCEGRMEFSQCPSHSYGVSAWVATRGFTKGYIKTYTTSQLQEIWSQRYQCEVLPAPRWRLPTVYKVGDLELVYDPSQFGGGRCIPE